jgi:hypothetical protein
MFDEMKENGINKGGEDEGGDEMFERPGGLHDGHNLGGWEDDVKIAPDGGRGLGKIRTMVPCDSGQKNY